MFNRNGNKIVSNRSRREILRNIVSIGTIATVGTGITSATSSGSDKNILLTFNPQKPEEVRKAYVQLSSLPNRKEVKDIVKKLTEAQVAALKDFGKEVEIVTTIETPDGTQYQISGNADPVSVDPSIADACPTASGDKTVKAVSKLKNQVGGTEATLEHFLHWEYSCSNVSNISHWKQVGTGVLYTFDRLSTNYLDNRGDKCVSRMVANFNACFGGPCVTKQLGTEIWGRSTGGWTVNQLR